MATKKLSRSVTEGGRHGRDFERFGTRIERRRVRYHLKNSDMDAVALPKRPNEWGTSFADRLKPINRFLQANAGRPWDKVFSELCSKYDRRSLKGWHMIDAHVLRHLVDKPGDRFKYGGVSYPPHDGAWIDEHGILRFTQFKKRKRR